MKPKTKRIIRMGGSFKLNGYDYQHPSLAEHQGQFVSAEYDPNDPSEVYVYETKGKAICVAQRVNTKSYWVPHCMGFDTAVPDGDKSTFFKVADLPDFIVHKGNTRNPQSKGRTEHILNALDKFLAERMDAHGIPHIIHDPDYLKATKSFISCKHDKGSVHPNKTKAYAEEKLAEALQVKEERPSIDQDLAWLFNECEERYNILKDALDDIRKGENSDLLGTQLAVDDMKSVLTLLDQHINSVIL